MIVCADEVIERETQCLQLAHRVVRGDAAIRSLSERSGHGQAFCRTEFMSSRPGHLQTLVRIPHIRKVGGAAEEVRLCSPCEVAETTRRANHFGLSEVMSRPQNKKISLHTSGKSLLQIHPSHPARGVAHVTNARWDAMDATASGAQGIAGRIALRERLSGARTNGAANCLDETRSDAYEVRRELWRDRRGR